MSEIKNIVILGKTIHLQERSKAQMKGATVGDLIAYRFYDGKFIEDYEKTNGKAPTTKELTDKFSSLLG